MNQSLRLAAMTMAAIVVFAACGGNTGSPGATGPSATGPAATSAGSAAPDSVQGKLDSLAGMTGDARQTFLIDEAEAAGPIVVYSNHGQELQDAFQAGLTAAFPDLDIQYASQGTNEFLEKVLAESGAGQPVASVYELGDPPSWATIFDENMMAKYTSPEAADFDDVFLHPEGYYTTLTYSLMINGYNTTLMDAAEVPTTLEQLADPKYKGLIARTGTGGGGRWIAEILRLMGREEGMALLERIAANDLRLFDSNSAAVESVVSGQLPLVIDTQAHGIDEVKEVGAPVEFVQSTPAFSLFTNLGVPADSPNPYGAALVIDWLLSADGGQALYDQLNRRGPRGDMDYPYQEEFEAIDELVPYSVEAVVETPDAADILNELFAN